MCLQLFTEGIRASRDDELGAESTDRGAQARATAAHTDAQSSSAHLHREYGQH